MRKIANALLIWLVIGLLFGCKSLGPAAPAARSSQESSPLLPAASDVPDVKMTAQAYLEAWKADDYSTMYGLLTSISQDAISADEFESHYRGIAAEAALSGVGYVIQSALVNGDVAQVNFQTILHSVVVGDVKANTVMHLQLENGHWRVQWDDTLVLPQLAGGNYLKMDLEIPGRANIYDRYGHALVAQTDATAIGLLPDQINPAQKDQLFSWLTKLTGLRTDSIQNLYSGYPAGSGWYLPLGEAPASEVAKNFDVLSGLSGLVLRPYKARFYFDGGVAPHVVGYVSALQPNEVEAYRRQGYKQDERVGRTGLEKWGEAYLAGKRGGTLYVFNARGMRETLLASAPAQSSQAIYTTLDRDFQEAAQEALSGFRGAIVVMERDTGRVVAMVSSPGFDPNAFEPTNFNYNTKLDEINNNPNQPLLNRATQGQYPLGSVFKIITAAAALESGDYTPDSTYYCNTTFTELPGAVLHDWTYDYGLPASGLLTLKGGLIRSCNPWFFHLGLDLYDRGLTTAVSDMARGFGLGSPTGIQGVDEAAGQVPDPQSMVDATNLAIGQGDLLVTPLQVADFIAAVGNGGTLYQPQVVEMIAPPDGEASYTFKPIVRGKLPVKAENLQAIQEALHGVLFSTDPYGTAVRSFSGVSVPQVSGKTGTAQSGSGLPHAWFAGYTYANRPDKPDIAAVVVVENVGEGSDYAAPIFRRILELYFSNNQQLGPVYRWESSYNVTQTPTPQGPTETTPTP
jgi:penicillin-binding protein 2